MIRMIWLLCNMIMKKVIQWNQKKNNWKIKFKKLNKTGQMKIILEIEQLICQNNKLQI